MSDTRTTSMLQRVPEILAITASSYGLAFDPSRPRKPEAAGHRRRAARDKHASDDKPAQR